MPNFEVINNSSEIPLNNQWIHSTKFNSKDRLVDAKGKAVSSDYKGRQYRIIEKRERIFSAPERIERIFLGTLAVVCTLFLGLFSKSIRNFFIKPKENVRFGVLVPPSSNLPSQFKVKTDQVHPTVSSSKPKKSDEERTISEKELQQGMSISEETIAKIQTCMKNVLERKEKGGIKFYNSQENHRVFALDIAPGLIFKMKVSKDCHALGKDDSMMARYQTMINAQTVLRTHQLGLLVLPHAKIFNVKAEGKEYEIIAEQKVDINPNESAQEQYFEEYADSLNETIRQLAIFICKTGYSDVEWRNNPVLNNSLDGNGNRKIALIDIEEIDSEETGLFGGGFGRTGLADLVSEEQGNIIESVAKQNNVSTSSFAYAHDRRKKALESNSKLKEYYATKNITKGDEPIHVDIDSLGLDINKEGRINTYVEVDGQLKREKKTVTLKTVIEDLVKEMNKLIQSNDPQKSAKGKRYFILDTQNEPFAAYDKLGLPEGKFMTTKEEEKQKWLPLIIQSFIEKGHIFKLDKVDGHGYFIQA